MLAFLSQLLAEMRLTSVSVPTIAEDSGMLKGYTQQPLSELATETELLWLTTVGILRREVDGQGLTDSFRLTPLGRTDRRALAISGLSGSASEPGGLCKKYGGAATPPA